jgi:hypothetical protein
VVQTRSPAISRLPAEAHSTVTAPPHCAPPPCFPPSSPSFCPWSASFCPFGLHHCACPQPACAACNLCHQKVRHRAARACARIRNPCAARTLKVLAPQPGMGSGGGTPPFVPTAHTIPCTPPAAVRRALQKSARASSQSCDAQCAMQHALCNRLCGWNRLWKRIQQFSPRIGLLHASSTAAALRLGAHSCPGACRRRRRRCCCRCRCLYRCARAGPAALG